MKKLLHLFVTFFTLTTFAQDDWERQSPIPFTAFTASGIDFSTTQHGFIVGDPLNYNLNNIAQVLETTDGGQTWQERIMADVDQPINDVFFLNQNLGWMVGNIHFKTTDGGVTWSEMNMPAGSYYNIRFLDANFGWARSNGGLLISENGGTSWSYYGYNNGDLDNGTFYMPDLGLGWNEGVMKRTTNAGQSWSTVYNAGIGSALFLSSSTAVASTSNAFIRSTDGGNNWSVVYNGSWSFYTTPHLLALSAQNIISYNQQGKIYISNNAGLSWTEVNVPEFIGAYHFTAVDANTALIFGVDGKVFRTADAGQSWTKVFTAAVIPVWASQQRTGQEILAVGNYGLIIQSNDNGLSWEFNSSGIAQEMRDMAFFNDQTGIAAGSFGFVLRTTDGGNHWVPSRPGFIYGADDLRSIDIVDENFAVVVGDGTFIKTMDAGITWSGYVPSTAHYADAEFINTQEGWLVTNYPYAEIVHTTDGGNTWEQQFFDGGFPLYSIVFADNMTGWAAGPGDVVLRTTNGGQTWNEVLLSPIAPGTIFDMEFYDGNTGWIAGESGYIAKTTNGGLSWIEQNSGLTYYLDNIMDIEIVNNQHLYACTITGIIIMTEDGGDTWTEILPPSQAENNSWQGMEITGAGIWVGSGEIHFKPSNNARLELRVLLEGSFNGTSLDTDLNPILPLEQPYNIPPWNYNGVESVSTIPNANIVDWVLVELRETAGGPSTATGGTIVSRQAAFLLQDGSIVGLDGTSLLPCPVVPSNNLYVVIRHRNHLGILSNNPLTALEGIYTCDFTTGASKVYGGALGYKELATGIWGMVSGDGNSDNQINEPDKSVIWKSEAGKSVYTQADMDMNSKVDNRDKNEHWVTNLGKISQIPDGETGK